MNDVQASPDEQAVDSTKSPTEDGEEMDLNSNQTSSEGQSEDLDKPVVKDKKTNGETDPNIIKQHINGVDKEKSSDKSENEEVGTEKDIKESTNKESKVTEKLKTDDQADESLEKNQSEKLEKLVEDDKTVQIEKETTERMEKDTEKILESTLETEKLKHSEQIVQVKSEPKMEEKVSESDVLKKKPDDKDQHKITEIDTVDHKSIKSNEKKQISDESEFHPGKNEVTNSTEVQATQKEISVEKEELPISNVIKKDVPESTSNESSSKVKTITNNVETKENISLKSSDHIQDIDKGKADSSLLEQREKCHSLSEEKTRLDLAADTDVSSKPNEIKQEDKSKLPGTHFDTNIIKTLEVSTTENQMTSKMSQNSKESKLGELEIINNVESKEVGSASKSVTDSRSPTSPEQKKSSEETKSEQSFKSNISSGTGSTAKEGIIMPQPDK